MSIEGWTFKAVLVAALVLLAFPAWAQEGDTAANDAAPADTDAAEASDSEGSADAEIEAEVEAEEERKSWSVGANTGISIGSATFVANDFIRKERIRWNFGMSASYTIPVIDVSMSARTGFSQWLTRGGGSQTPQEFRWSDTSLGFSRAIYTIPVVDVAIGGSVGFTIPTSRYSRTSDLYTSISPGLSFSTSAGPVGFSYGISYGVNFHANTSTTYDPSDVDVLSRSSGNEIVQGDAIATGGVLTQHSISNAFGISYTFPIPITLAIGFGFGDSWSYDNGTITKDDEFVAENADVGRVHSQSTNGSISLSYSPIQYLSLSTSFSSSQGWKTADNQGFRFPFYDFQGGAAGGSMYMSFGLSGRY